MYVLMIDATLQRLNVCSSLFQYFFHPRQVDVTLTEGSSRFLGQDNGMQGGDMYRRNYRSDRDYASDSSSSSSSGGNWRYRDGRKASRKAEKRERKAEKRAAKAERRFSRRDRGSRDDQFMLVVSYRPPMAY